MPRMLNPETGKVENLPDSAIYGAMNAGYTPVEGEGYNVRNRAGDLVSVPGESLSTALSQGFKLEGEQERFGRLGKEATAEAFGGIGGGIEAGVAGALRGATLGLSDVALRGAGADPASLRGLREAHPTISTVAEIGGAIAPALLTGGAAAPVAAAGAGRLARAGRTAQKILRASPAGMATRAGTRIAGRGAAAGLAGKTAATAAGFGLEGAMFSSGHVLSEVALENRELSAEAFIGGMGQGALWGGALGAGFTVASAAAKAAGRGIGGVARRGAARKAKSTTLDKTIPKKKRTSKAQKRRENDFQNEMARQVSHGEHFMSRADTIFRKAGEAEAARLAPLQAKRMAAEGARADAMKWVEGIRKENPILTKAERGRVPSSRDMPSEKAQKAPWWQQQREPGDAGRVYQRRGEIDMGAFKSSSQRVSPSDAATAPGGQGFMPSMESKAIREISNYEHAQHEFAKELRPHLDIHDVAKLDEAIKPYADAVAKQATAGKEAAARGGGRFDTMAEWGGSLEWAQSLGVPGVPDVDQLPVVGPLLSLYLKYRAVRAGASKIFRGSTAAVAEKAASTQNRVSDGVSGFLKAAEKAGQVAAKVAVPTTAAILHSPLFDAGAPEKRLPKIAQPAPDVAAVAAQKAYGKRMAELNHALANPEGIRRRVRQAVPGGRPEVQAAIEDVVVRKLEFLHDKAPKDPRGPNPLGLERVWRPSTEELAKWASYVRAADDPSTVLDDMKAGKLTPEAVEAVKVVYPQIYAEMQEEIIDNAAELQESLPFGKRVQLSILFDVPIDDSMRPGFIKFSQDSYAEQAPTPQEATIQAPITLSEQATLGLHRRASR